MSDHGGLTVDVSQRLTEQHGELTVPEEHVKKDLVIQQEEWKQPPGCGVEMQPSSAPSLRRPRLSVMQVISFKLFQRFINV